MAVTPEEAPVNRIDDGADGPGGGRPPSAHHVHDPFEVTIQMDGIGRHLEGARRPRGAHAKPQPRPLQEPADGPVFVDESSTARPPPAADRAGLRHRLRRVRRGGRRHPLLRQLLRALGAVARTGGRTPGHRRHPGPARGVRGGHGRPRGRDRARRRHRPRGRDERGPGHPVGRHRPQRRARGHPGRPGHRHGPRAHRDHPGRPGPQALRHPRPRHARRPADPARAAPGRVRGPMRPSPRRRPATAAAPFRRPARPPPHRPPSTPWRAPPRPRRTRPPEAVSP